MRSTRPSQQSRLARWLTLALGLIYALMGILEVVLRLEDPDFGPMFFLGGSLLVGALLTLGALYGPVPGKYRTGMIIVGAIVGLVATAWTLVVPILAIAVVLLNLRGKTTCRS